MWQHRETPTNMGWKILVLVSKGNTDTRGIGLLDTLCKVVESIIDTHLRASISFHYVLCVFCVVRVTGAAILDLKLD